MYFRRFLRLFRFFSEPFKIQLRQLVKQNSRFLQVLLNGVLLRRSVFVDLIENHSVFELLIVKHRFFDISAEAAGFEISPDQLRRLKQRRCGQSFRIRASGFPELPFNIRTLEYETQIQLSRFLVEDIADVDAAGLLILFRDPNVRNFCPGICSRKPRDLKFSRRIDPGICNACGDRLQDHILKRVPKILSVEACVICYKRVQTV